MIKKLFILLAITAALVSCTHDIGDGRDGQSASIVLHGFNTRNNTDPIEDQTVTSLRVMAFNPSSAVCESNELYTGVSLYQQIIHTMEIGTYNFVFLANEPTAAENPAIATALANVHIRADLNSIAYPASLFGPDREIPMVQMVDKVTVGNDVIAFSDGTTTTLWELALLRLGIRVDMKLWARDDLSAESIFQGINFNSLPDVVPLTGQYSGTINRTGTRQFLPGNSHLSLISDPTTVDSEAAWAMNVERIILPSTEFTPVGNTDNAIQLEAMMTTQNRSSLMGVNPDTDYTIPKNTWMNITARITLPLELNIQASDWTEALNNWQIPNRYLSVSHIETNITGLNGARVTFTSSMPDVRVLENAYVGTGTTTIPVASVFNDLVSTASSPNTSRFQYTYDSTTGIGTGYMDILADQLNTPGTYKHRIVLSAGYGYGSGGLQREITVNSTIGHSRLMFDTYTSYYVGSFHRNAEVGERVISGQHPDDWNTIKVNGVDVSVNTPNSPWTAEVVDGADFITITATLSFDPNIETNNPGNPEYFPVTDGISTGMISGKGRIYFRIGMKSANTGSAPRYGRIRITPYRYWGYPSNEWSGNGLPVYLYVRQGEDADYVFGPESGDIITAGPMNGLLRTAARKFSPYNLTAPAFKSGNTSNYVSLQSQQGEFVDYPSQAGAMFQFVQDPLSFATDDGTYGEDRSAFVRLAYHPTNTITPATQWSRNFMEPDMYWGNKYYTQETCPDNYRRPNDGTTSAISSNTTAGTNANTSIRYSEMRQSLFLNPTTGDASSIMNTYEPVEGNRAFTYYAYGFYADGYFDRRQVSQINGLHAVVKESENSPRVAYVGMVFFNPNNNHSLFMPFSGGRDQGQGNLFNVATAGSYWSSSTGIQANDESSNAAGWMLMGTLWGEIIEGKELPVPSMATTLPSTAVSVRCVLDE